MSSQEGGWSVGRLYDMKRGKKKETSDCTMPKTSPLTYPVYNINAIKSCFFLCSLPGPPLSHENSTQPAIMDSRCIKSGRGEIGVLRQPRSLSFIQRLLHTAGPTVQAVYILCGGIGNPMTMPSCNHMIDNVTHKAVTMMIIFVIAAANFSMWVTSVCSCHGNLWTSSYIFLSATPAVLLACQLDSLAVTATNSSMLLVRKHR